MLLHVGKITYQRMGPFIKEKNKDKFLLNQNKLFLNSPGLSTVKARSTDKTI